VSRVEIKKLSVPEFNNGVEMSGWDDVYRKSDAKTRDKMDKDINFLLKDKNNDLDPILIRKDGKFLDVEDGHHRVASYISAGREDIPFAYEKSTPKNNPLLKEAQKHESYADFIKTLDTGYEENFFTKKDPRADELMASFQ
jgi:hypothetical protein